MIDASKILLVEDSEADAELTMDALLERNDKLDLSHAIDGPHAIALIEEMSSRDELPGLIVLDLNLPGMGGQHVLGHLKADPVLRRIPVVILSSSEAESDIVGSYDRGANCYVTKPIGLTEYRAAIYEMEQFWLNLARLPR